MIIDAHTHLPSENWSGDNGPFATVAEAVVYLKAAGTDAALFNTWQGVFAESAEDLEVANAEALALTEAYPGFLYPGAVIHPAFPDVSHKWLARFRELGYPWVGELVAYKLPYRYIDDDALALFAACAEGRHILQLHNSEDTIALARRFPDMPIVSSHIDYALLPRLAAEPNIRLDISGWCGGLGIGGIEKAYQAFGPDRLLYGTDFTGYEPRAFQTRLQIAVPNPAEREQILCKNLLRLLESVGARPIMPQAT